MAFNEHALEMGIMELFEQQGYSCQNGETIHKELSDVLLRDDLKLYLMDRYSAEGITALEVERVIAKLTADNGAPLYQQNAQTYRLMTEGFTIKREDASKPDLFVEVIDFKNVERNIFKVVTVAYGMKDSFHEVKADHIASLRNVLIHHFGRGSYYLRRNGLRPITPEEQQFISSIFRQYGYEAKFDRMEEETEWL